MPKGMYLESEGFASNLSEPSASYTIWKATAKSMARPTEHLGGPVSRDVFVDDANGVPEKNTRQASRKGRVTSPSTWRLDGFHQATTSSGGEQFFASKAIIAAGMDPFTPPELERLPNHLRSHAVDHVDLSVFRAKPSPSSRPAPVGAGSRRVIVRRKAPRQFSCPASSRSRWNRATLKAGQVAFSIVWRSPALSRVSAKVSSHGSLTPTRRFFICFQVGSASTSLKA